MATRRSFIRIAVLQCANIIAAYIMYVLMTYLTDVWKLSITQAAAIVNVYSGLVAIMPIGMAFLLNHCLGIYWMLFLSSVTYSIGLSFLAMSTPPFLSKVTGTCSEYEPACIGKIQSIFFYVGLALIAVGKSSHSVSVKSFWEVQEENQEHEEKQTKFQEFLQKLKEMGDFQVILASVAPIILVAYIKPWTVRFGIPAIFSVVATLIFLSSSWSYNFIKPPQTSGIRSLSLSRSHHTKSSKGVCEDGAATTLPSQTLEEGCNNELRLLRTEGANETRVILRIIPMWITFVVCGIVISTGNTYFLEQANHMNNKLGSLHVPVEFLFWYYNMTKLSKTFEIFKNIIPASLLASCPIFYSAICCIIAARVEFKRLHVVKKYGLIDKPEDTIPMSMFWLLPQLFFLGLIEGSAENYFSDFCAQEVPDLMKRYVLFLSKGVLGAGTIGSVFFVYIVEKVSQRGGRLSWFQDTLNRSSLDNYYWVLAVLTSINFVVYLVLACRFMYRCLKRECEREYESTPPSII
ncbi:hypothetical protein HHK36_022343 [Tetracentron sinense]|uniref:Uncharacterized protein n=1 Tax=Tetracentron sinense TaxID=13715 RepID=A0A834YSR3_TETSI|nr:hypothetical protein HHK36_022343 [Tetracentron sinense]